MNVSQIQFSQSLADIDLYQLQELFNLAAFWAKERSIKDWGTAIANSEPVVSIWD
ncbi:MAG: GNAT family N-acetyltransferase, partial [Nostocales cyanobacterium ELA608]